MRHVSDVNDQYILQLKASLNYYNLSWYQLPFFPTTLASALDSYNKNHPSTLRDVRDAYLNHTWFFQRWIIPGLFEFYKTPLGQDFGTAAESLEWVTDLHSKFSTLPAGVTVVDLSNNDLDYKTCAQLTEVLSALPAQVTSVNLSNNHLGKIKVDKLAIAFSALPVSVTSIDLRENFSGEEMERITGNELAKLFTALPASVTSVDLSSNNFYMKTNDELKIAFAALPKGLTSISLMSNGLGSVRFDLAQIFSVLPKGLTSINLSGNGFYRITGDTLAEAIAVLPRSLTSIDLSRNHLFLKTDESLATAFKALPEGLISINLEGNREIYFLITGADLAKSLKVLPKGLRSLDLSRNNFYRMEDLAIAVAAIPKNVTSLNLSGNFTFAYLSSASLAEIIAALPPTLTSLDIGGDYFFARTRTPAYFTIVFAAFSENITSLNLEQSRIEMMPLIELMQLAGKLPHIKSLTISFSEIKDMPPENRQAFKEIFPGIARLEDIILVDSPFNWKDIPPPLNAQKCWRDLGIVPSCKMMSTFFVKKAIYNGDLLAPEANDLPLDVQTYLDTFTPPTSNTLKI